MRNKAKYIFHMDSDNIEDIEAFRKLLDKLKVTVEIVVEQR